MKKISLILLAVVMILSLAACADGNKPSDDGSSTGSSQNAATNSQTPSEIGSENGQPDKEPEGSKILVAYFSATNNTEGLAQKLADGLGADLYEIVPEQPYTSEDLNYGDSKSRSSAEMNDPNARPAISVSVENIDDYDIIFLGYPIWWGQAPKIMYTFVESYVLSSKTIVPFCTSGSSPIGSSATNMHSSASDATWLDGHRFSAGASAEDVLAWANGLGIN